MTISSKKQNSNKSENKTNGYKGPRGDEELLGYRVFEYGKAKNKINSTRSLRQSSATLDIPVLNLET